MGKPQLNLGTASGAFAEDSRLQGKTIGRCLSSHPFNKFDKTIDLWTGSEYFRYLKFLLHKPRNSHTRVMRYYSKIPCWLIVRPLQEHQKCHSVTATTGSKNQTFDNSKTKIWLLFRQRLCARHLRNKQCSHPVQNLANFPKQWQLIVKLAYKLLCRFTMRYNLRSLLC